MVIFVDLDTQTVIESPNVLGSPASLTAPRASNIPIWVQFCRGGIVVDPEISYWDILTSSTGSGTVFTAPAHPFIVGDTVSISDHTGLDIRISSSSVSSPAGANVQTVTMTIANPCVVSALGYAAGDSISFSTTGVLPTGLTAGTTYYVISTGLTASACQISATLGGSAITTSGSQSGVHTATNLSRCLITTMTAHGMIAGDHGTAANGTALANPTYLVNISGHGTAVALSGNVLTVTSNPAVVTTSVAHGLSTGDLVTIAGCTLPAANVTAVAVVTGATTFTFTGVNGSSGGTLGTFTRLASDLNGQHVATWVSATTFTIPVANYTILNGGTVTVTTTTPIANTADGATRTVTAVTTNTFTIGALNLSAAGKGGTAAAISATPFALRWTVKNNEEYDGPTVATCTSFAKSGKGQQTIYKGTCNYITTELNSLLGIDASTSGSISGITGSTWTSSTHGLVAGDSIVFAASVIPGGVVAAQTYYILTAPTTTSFTIAATVGGTVITPTSSGTTVTFVGYPVADDVEKATLMAELSWAGASPSKTSPIIHYIKNDIYKGGESTPVSAVGQIGSTTIVDGDSEVSVTFDPILGTANWHFMGSPYVENTTAAALGLSFMGLSTKTASGFTAILSGAANGIGTYKLRWIVQPD